jgi:uncharacterized membrane-anchored protein
VIDEVEVYRIVGTGFLVALPVALTCMILPARTPVRKRVRWSAVAFISLGTAFVGWVASWPGPNSLTSIMMLGGLAGFLSAVYFLARSFTQTKANSPSAESR